MNAQDDCLDQLRSNMPIMSFLLYGRPASCSAGHQELSSNKTNNTVLSCESLCSLHLWEFAMST